MADQQLEFEFIADDKPVAKALGDVEKKAKDTGEKIEKGFSKRDLFGSDKALDLKAVLGEVGDEVQGVIGRFGRLGLVAAGVAVAGLAVKKAFDFAMEGERIRQINTTFEILTSQAGANAAQLRSQLEAAAGGVSDMESILQSASTAATEFSDRVDKLPQLLELARAASIQFGGTVEDRFNQIVQAVASGNTRVLRQIGLFIDAGKVVEDFANATGRARSELTQTAERQAILNAVLERGSKVYAGVDIENKSLAQSSQSVKVAMDDISDAFAGIADSVLGQVFRDAADGVAALARSLGALGPAIETPSRRLTAINQELATYQTRLNELTQEAAANNEKLAKSQELYNRQREGTAGFFETIIGSFNSGIDPRFLQKPIDEVISQMRRLEEERKKIQDSLKPTEREGLFNDSGQKERIEAVKKFNDQLRGIQNETARLRLQNVLASSTTEQALYFQEEEAQRQSAQRKLAIQQQFATDAQLLEVQQKQFELQRSTFSEEQRLTIQRGLDSRRIEMSRQRNALLAAEETRHEQEMENLRRDAAQKQAVEEQASKERMIALTKQFYNGLLSASTAGLARVGAALVEGRDAFEGFFGQVCNILGDLAIQIGTALIGIGFGIENLKTALLTLNGGAAIAAGAALVIAGGALKAIASKNGAGASASPSTGTGGGITGGGGISGDTGPAIPVAPPEELEAERPQTIVELNVSGNVMGTSNKDLALALTELLRDEFDSQGLVLGVKA